MTGKFKYPVAIAAVFIWVGFVCAISFMEAWLKFRAPGISLSLGLGIGRIVFHALNKVEIILSLVILISMLRSGLTGLKWTQLFFLIPFLILVVQSLWLLPALDARVELYLQEIVPQSSKLHLYYIVLEFVKVIGLLLFGFSLLTKQH